MNLTKLVAHLAIVSLAVNTFAEASVPATGHA
ncbi:hypothetical protein PC129_g16501, partial [Phytophthora cactorum]